MKQAFWGDLGATKEFTRPLCLFEDGAIFCSNGAQRFSSSSSSSNSSSEAASVGAAGSLGSAAC